MWTGVHRHTSPMTVMNTAMITSVMNVAPLIIGLRGGLP
jgi:hypothetical protein